MTFCYSNWRMLTQGPQRCVLGIGITYFHCLAPHPRQSPPKQSHSLWPTRQDFKPKSVEVEKKSPTISKEATEAHGGRGNHLGKAKKYSFWSSDPLSSGPLCSSQTVALRDNLALLSSSQPMETSLRLSQQSSPSRGSVRCD